MACKSRIKYDNPMKRLFILLSLLLLVGGCAGYNFVGPKNPFAQYGVQSITVPMFVNHSAITGVTGVLTKEIRLRLQRYSGLKVSSGESSSTDAVLVGIIDSADSRYQVFTPAARKFTESELASSLGARSQFYVPTSTNYQFSLKLVLIKRPSEADLEFLSQGQLSPLLSRHPRVIFSQELNLTSSFTRYLEGNVNVDSAGVVNYTKSQGVFESSLDALAKSAANQFETVVIHVF